MLWTDERIAEIVDRLIAGGQRAFATEALQEMRSEYESRIADLTKALDAAKQHAVYS